METIFANLNYLFIVLIILSPIIILIILKRLRIKETLLFYSIFNLIIMGVLILIFAWWADKYDLILMENLGYNFEGMDENEIFQNVSKNNLEKVKLLESRIMGIGWPLKAIFAYVFSIPYLIIVYYVNILIKRLFN